MPLAAGQGHPFPRQACAAVSYWSMAGGPQFRIVTGLLALRILVVILVGDIGIAGHLSRKAGGCMERE